MTSTQTSKRTLTGIVVSNAMDKTVVVRVSRTKIHPMYRKRYQVNRKYKAHDPKNEYQVNDEVVIEETRPISRDKRWRVITKLNKA